MIKLTLAAAFSAAVLLTACGKQESAPAPEPAPATAPAPAVAAAPAAGAGSDVGKGIYNKTCALCHAAGVAGAPRPGDKADWGPRIAQGNEVMYQHAIAGFTGAKGAMPAKGGNPALSDDDVKAAVDFMVAQSR